MFILDATIAIIIIVVAATLLFYNFLRVDRPVYFTERISEDIIGVMSYTKLTDICVDLYDEDNCDCPKYPKIKDVACSYKTTNKDSSVLSMLNEGVERAVLPDAEVEAIIKDIFVDKKIIDEKRFGFAILYTKPDTGETLEIYNSDKAAT